MSVITGLGSTWHPTRRPVVRGRGTHVLLEGNLPSGRAAKVTFFDESNGSSAWTHVRFRVAADEAPSLTVTEEGLSTKVAKAAGWQEEIEVGDETFDKRFLLETHEPERARKVLGKELRRVIATVFDAGVRDLKIEGGFIDVTAPVGRIRPDDYAKMLETLDRAARTLDRKKIAVRVLGGERSALVDHTGKTRCPYCHDGITGDEADLVACELCATVLHEGCWKEHGGCPLLGCKGKSPERARPA